MEKEELEKLAQEASVDILDSIYLLQILDDLIDGEPKESIFIKTLNQKINSAFCKINDCRKNLNVNF